MTQICKKEYNEILEVLKFIPSYDYLKIPQEKIDYFKEHCVKDYDFKIDNTKELQLSKNTYALYTDLYRNYIATEEEKTIINEILDLNTKKKDQSFAEKDLFKHNDKQSKAEANMLVTKKESLLRRFINKIKLFLNR